MGNPKQKWTAEEEEALKNGVAKHGTGKWKCIQKDPEFHRYLSSRSNIDLKDKWRNMNAAGQGPRDKSRSLKPKPPQASPAAPAAPVAPIKAQITLVPVVHEPPVNNIKEDSAKDLPDGKNVASDTTKMIFEALANDQNGLEIAAIVSYVEQRMTGKAPPNHRKQLGAKLRRLVQQEKLEKVEHCYRLKNNSLVETSRKDICPRPPLAIANIKVGESLEEAAKTAAYKVAEAEEKAYYASVAVRDHERYTKMQEETNTTLQLAKEIYDRCHNGEILMVA